MSDEKILALLKSDYEADNLLGLHILRAKSPDWTEFKCKLGELTITEYYEDTSYINWRTKKPFISSLRDKYFDKSRNFELKIKYYNEIP